MNETRHGSFSPEDGFFPSAKFCSNVGQKVTSRFRGQTNKQHTHTHTQIYIT